MSADRPNFSVQTLLDSGRELRCYVIDSEGKLGINTAGALATIELTSDLDAWLLGRTIDGTVHCAIWLGSAPEEGSHARINIDLEGIRFANLTDIGVELSDDESLLGAQAVALAKWHGRTRYCSRCGEAVSSLEAGWANLCKGCGAVEYPRTDPAVIVRVTDVADRILLAHNTAWDNAMMSLPAGFVEAGETPTRTVVREVFEEIGIRVSDVQYLGAQPWPGPRSLMLAFSARIDVPTFVASKSEVSSISWIDPDIKPDGVEIDHARFFTREEYGQALRKGEIRAPRPTSIAHAMLTQWFGKALPNPESE